MIDENSDINSFKNVSVMVLILTNWVAKVKNLQNKGLQLTSCFVVILCVNDLLGYICRYKCLNMYVYVKSM